MTKGEDRRGLPGERIRRVEGEGRHSGEHEWYNWALARNGVYFLKHHENGGELDFFDFATGKTTTILTSHKQPGIGLAVSADSKSILYAEIELEDSNIMQSAAPARF